MPTTEVKRSNPVVVWGAILLIILLLVFATRWLTRERVQVHVASPTFQDLLRQVSTNGKVEPIQEFQAHAAAPGEVAKLYVEVGDLVKPGTLLVKMADSEIQERLANSQLSISSAQVGLDTVQQNGSQDERLGMLGDLNKAKLEQQQASRDLAALKQLQQKGAASASEVSSAEQHLANANASLANLQSRSNGRFSPNEIARAQQQLADAQAQRAAALSSYAGANIRSTIAGTVYSVPVSEYDYVNAGEDLVDVADLNRVRVRAYFDEPEIGNLADGQPVKITWDAKLGRTWHGHIYRTPTTVITYGTRNVGECIITVDDAKGDLLPNTNVTVTVTTREDDNVLSIPREALHTDGPQSYVFRVVNNRLVRTPVQLGVVNLTRAEITSGLTPKDVVALNALNNTNLTNGLAIKPVE
jgi:HlyD family secretion protein